MRVPACTSLIAAWLIITGCRSKQRSSVEPEPAATNAEVYSRVDTRFDAAIYSKPDEPSADELTVQLAPLVVQAVDPQSSASSGSSRLAAILDRSRGEWELDATRPTVYTGTSIARLQGREFEQRSYLWFYASADVKGKAGPRTASGARGPPEHCRGYRMTLDAEGFPIIWELLGTVPPPVRIFVARRLEDAAAHSFGPPLPHRRFSIETAFDRNPNIVVARALDDAPMPMGPIYYLTAELDVPTLICRCMPSQYRAVAEEIRYTLAPLGSLGASASRIEAASFPLPDMRIPEWLETVLRLPADF